MPDRIQQAVWAHFDDLHDPAWPIHYRLPEDERMDLLGKLGIIRHTALAYAHRPGVAAWLNEHTLAVAAEHPQVVPTFTLYPEPEAAEYVAAALDAGGRCVKVHLQVGKFDLADPLLDEAWATLERARTPIILHLAAVGDGSGGEEFCGAHALWRLLERHPDLRPVIAHMGAPGAAAELFERASELPELRFDTAMAVLPAPRLWTPPPWLPDRLGEFADRIMFGSDYPTVPSPLADQVAALVAFGLGEDWLRAVFWENAAELFGAGDSPRLIRQAPTGPVEENPLAAPATT